MRLVFEEGKAASQIARDLDVTETALREWANGAPADLPRSSATGTN